MRKKNTQKSHARLKKVEAPNVTSVEGDFPIVVHKSLGCYVKDVHGNRYLDANSFFGVAALGHRHSSTLRAIRAQTAKLIHGMGDVHPTDVKIKLMEHIKALSPFGDKGRVYLAQSGAEVIEYALKTAILKTKRSKFLSFNGAYHGLLMGSMGLTNRHLFRDGFENWLRDSFVSLPFPSSEGVFGNSDSSLREEIEHIEKMIPEKLCLEMVKKNLSSQEFAAVVLEPIQGRGGVRKFSANFLKELKQLCQKYGTVLIFDEIYTGFWRTGDIFCTYETKVTPDLLCIGKALGGGLPLSACVGEILNVWGECKGEARHTSTFSGHPLACGVGVETIKVMQRLQKSFRTKEKELKKALERFCDWYKVTNLSKKFPMFLRGQGWMYGLVFVEHEHHIAAQLMKSAVEHGLIVLPCGEFSNVLTIAPPLISTSQEFHLMIEKLKKAVMSLEKKYV